MKNKHKSLSHFLEYLGLLVLYGIFRLVPFRLSVHFFTFLSGVLPAVIRVRQKVIRENLRQAFPGASEERVEELIKGIYRHFLLFVNEFIHLTRFRAVAGKESGDQDSARLPFQVTEIEGEEYLREVGGWDKPFLILTGHMGNWELMGAYFAMKGVRASVLAKPIHNPFVDQFVNRIRKKVGIEVISTRDRPMRSVLKALKAGRVVAFLADQDARRAGILLDFFQKPASTFTGPALFSLRTGLPLLPVFDVRTGPFSHKVIFKPPIYPPAEAVRQGGKTRDQAIREITEKHVRRLEEIIRRHPDQYFWFHRRWKTQPKRKN